MREAYDQRAGLGYTVQDPGGNQWVRCSFSLPQHEGHQQDEARHQDAQDLRRLPREDYSAEIQTQQCEDRHAHDNRRPNPVHLATLPGGSELRVGGVQEHVQDDKGDKAARQVDPENPAPVQILCKHAAQEWTDAGGDGPDETGGCQEHASVALICQL
jgi:hypothetical protein